MNYEQIAKKYNLTIPLIYRRVFVLKLKGRIIRKKIYLSQPQIDKIVNYKRPKKDNLKNNKRKLTIIEWWFRTPSYRKISYILNIPRKLVTEAVREFEDTGFIVVESKMNKNE